MFNVAGGKGTYGNTPFSIPSVANSIPVRDGSGNLNGNLIGNVTGNIVGPITSPLTFKGVYAPFTNLIQLVPSVTGQEASVMFNRSSTFATPSVAGDCWILGSNCWGAGDRSFSIGTPVIQQCLTIADTGVTTIPAGLIVEGVGLQGLCGTLTFTGSGAAFGNTPITQFEVSSSTVAATGATTANTIIHFTQIGSTSGSISLKKTIMVEGLSGTAASSSAITFQIPSFAAIYNPLVNITSCIQVSSNGTASIGSVTITTAGAIVLSPLSGTFTSGQAFAFSTFSVTYF